MKTTVRQSDFVRAFDEYDRSANFTVAGREALFDYLEELEDSTGKEMELDVIAICCDFEEYANIQEFVDAYGGSYVEWDVEPEEADEEEGTEEVDGEIDYENTLDNIRYHTTVIDIDGESFIIQSF